VGGVFNIREDGETESMAKVCQWFKEKRVDVHEYLQQKQPNCTPNAKWWVQLMAVAAFSNKTSTTFKLLQGHSVTVAAQHAHIDSLQTSLMQTVNCVGPLSVGETSSLCSVEWYLEEQGRFAVKLSNLRAFINNLGTFAQSKLGQVSQNDVNVLVKEVARLYTMSIAGINTIRAEKDENNGAADSNSMLPPVLAHQVAVLPHAEFCAIVSTHTERLLSIFSRRDVDALEQEHKAFVDAITHKEPLRNVLNDHDATVPFSDSWKCLGDRFKLLVSFCGGIATIFPGPSQVESDFSIIKFEKDEFRSSIMDLSLEGVLHCKQFNMISKISLAS
jgi:arsenate reductase-like glutaredoxin family protein